MSFKSRFADIISDVLYNALAKKSLNYHVSLRNFNRSKPDHVDILDFQLLSVYNKKYQEYFVYEQALDATDLRNEDNLSKRLRHYTLFQLLKTTLQSVEGGDVVECGCFKGQSAYGLATIMKGLDYKHRFMIFDSFEGLSDLAPEDINELRTLSAEEIQSQKNCFAASQELVQKNLKEFNFIDYYKGWIPDRFNEVSDRKFAFVNIDVDLYLPIKDSLDFFYPRLQEGGVIFLDDYGMSQFPGAKQATDEFLEKVKPSFFMYLPFGGAFIKK